MRKRYFLPILGLIIISCKDQGNEPGEKLPEVPVVSVSSKTVDMERIYVSDIQAIRNVEIRSKISGFLVGIYVDEGQQVKKGQVLFKIGDAEYSAEVARARATLNSTRAEAHITELECERVRQMVEKKIISQSELELAMSKLKAATARIEEAESALRHAQHRLSYTTICAPFDGIVDRIPLKSGSLVSEGALITTVSDISSMYAYFNISENEYLALKRAADTTEIKNRRVALVLADGQNYDHEGVIETVVSEFDESTGSISVRARFPNPMHLLKHRATGKIRHVSASKEALLVPQKAAFEIQDKNYVYVLDNANVVKMRNFQPAGRVGQCYIVGAGLKQGDRIVCEGIQSLKEGLKVKPVVFADSGSLIASF